MKKSMLLILVLVFFGVMTTDTAKILVIPFNSDSIINFFTILGTALKDDGHEVWMLAYDKYDETIEERGIIPLTFPLKPEDNQMAKFDELAVNDPEGKHIWENWLSDPWSGKCFSRICDQVMQSERITGTIQEQKFDLVVYDGSGEISCHLMIPYRYSIPFVTVHVFQVASWVAGVTGMPSIEPEIITPISNRMNFWERLENFKIWLERVDDYFYDLYSDHMERYRPEKKPKIPLKKVAEMSQMYFVSYEIMCLDYPRVSAPNMKYLGAVTAMPAQPLPEDLEAIVSGAEHGVILMTFGTKLSAHQAWQLICEKIFEAFAQLPQQVIVQYRLDKFYGKVPSNVKIMRWLPQNDILGHSNVKLFITHGGNNGQNEAAYHGIPMLVIPFFIDQKYNAKRVEVHTYGKVVYDKKTVTANELYEMMTEILNNKTYAQNIKTCSEIIRSLPTPNETFVFWVNHILQFGGAHLRPASLDMPLYQVLMLDIVAYYVIYYIFIVSVGSCLLYVILKYVCKHLQGWKRKAE